MIDMNPNQSFYNPSDGFFPPNAGFGNEMFMNQPTNLNSRKRQGKSSPLSRIPSLYLPAIILFAFSWLLQALATFIPYWSVYPSISGGRAGLWSAQNFNYFSIQNFYFPEPNSFPTNANSLRFTNANTKGYVVTVQFLMTFNFVFMLIVLVLLVADYVLSRRAEGNPRGFLIGDYNTSETGLRFGLLLYILYVFIIFEFAAWITYVGSRQDNNWQMHVCFAFAVIISVFLVIVFVMFLIEFIKTFTKRRLRWEYWYGQYIEWGFFVYLSALLLLLIVICCPEWAYGKNDVYFIFAEIGLFKQCYLWPLFKKSQSSGLCTLSDTRTNQAWVNATQAFMLMAYIIGILILIVIVVFRREFLHNGAGYIAERIAQPTFTYMIAGLILFFCFIFTLIGVSIFGAFVFPYTLQVNWAYILAVFAMVMFLIAAILFILDAVHSKRQSNIKDSSPARKFFFPPPLNNRIAATRPLLLPEPAWPPRSMIPPIIPWQPPTPLFSDVPFYPSQPMMMSPNYSMDPYSSAPITRTALANFFLQMHNNPQLSSVPPLPLNPGLIAYSDIDPWRIPNNISNNKNKNMSDMVRQHFLQQQRLNYNHERLLERYSRLSTPRISQFQTFGSSSLPGRNYDEYLTDMRGGRRDGNSLAALSRAGIGTSDETYRWMGDESADPLPRDISSIMQHSRNEPMPFVLAEKFEPVKVYNHPLYGPTPAYIRPIYTKTNNSNKDTDENEIKSDNSDHEEETKTPPKSIIDDGYTLPNHANLGYISYKNWKTKNDQLIPVNPLLFNIYTQRSNGSIQSYGQSLYVPSAHHNRDKRPSHYEDISTLVPSDAGSVLADAPLDNPSSSSHRYNKLHSESASTTVSHQPLQPASTENNLDSSDKESVRSDLLSRNNSHLIKMSLLSSSIPSTSRIAPPVSTTTPTTDALSIQNTSVINNTVSPKSNSIATSSSTGRYQTLSSINNNPSTVVPLSVSTRTPSNPKTATSFDGALSLSAVGDAVSSSNDSDDDDDEKKKKRRRQNKKSAAIIIDDNGDVYSSSSDD